MRSRIVRGDPKETARPVRLPTEAEWEFAARGRQQALFPWGDVMPEWIPNGGRGPLQAPWPVTLGEPNDFGLFGIATNVHEWCADWHDKDYYARSPERNPAGPDQGVRRAVARRRVAARAHHVPRHAPQQARSVVPLQRLRVPPCAKPLIHTMWPRLRVADEQSTNRRIFARRGSLYALSCARHRL